MNKAPEDSGAPASRIVVLGEVLYDVFPDRKTVLGGAPFNVSWGLCALGLNPYLVSCVGNDSRGLEALAKMKAWGMGTSGIRIDSKHSTGVVEMSIEAGEPSYLIERDSALDYLNLDTIPECALLYHGSLALRGDANRKAFQRILEDPSIKRFFDVNLRSPDYSITYVKSLLKGAYWVKMNLEELAVLIGEPSLDFDDCESQIDQMLSSYSIENFILTAGEQGAIIKGMVGRSVVGPAPKGVDILDTVGAGDAFSCVSIYGALQDYLSERIINEASLFASKVCGIRGAISEDPEFYRFVD